MAFAIKAEVVGEESTSLVFTALKTMYDGKRIQKGDVVYIFDSENDGGIGLWGRGRVTSAAAVARSPDLSRQTPRVSVSVSDVSRAVRTLGRTDLKHFKDWQDGRPETELNFKFYRQATNKVIGLSSLATAYLDGYFID